MFRDTVERRHKWSSRQNLSPGGNYERFAVDEIGDWPAVYKAQNGPIIVTALYFKPKADLWIRLISIALCIPPVLVAADLTHVSDDTTGWITGLGIMAATGFIAWQIVRIFVYRMVAKRLVVEFWEDGSLRGPGFTIPGNMGRSFEVADAHPKAKGEELAEQALLRRKPQSPPQPRYYRDASQVYVRFGGGNMHRKVIADIDADDVRTQAERFCRKFADRPPAV